ncbi:MAG TPA: YlxR family protein [Candidatus Limnocylindria bacterium]|nr:YlxR family protein [Candidatus Limnocylindria bacterium]
MPKRKPEHQPQRTCAVCREVRPKRSMTRIVRRADGSVAADASGKAPGRGTYVCDRAGCREPGALADGVRRALGVAVALDLDGLEATRATA